ncbi:MAG: chorion class high-cysteine HCB protein 13 [Lachnospiraceae bacterium]|nr:chorion class high-cysteine HCB protein 13 [Lachnospiraceae bacterium]
MSDLTATHCGCAQNNDNGCGGFFWIIILLFLCGGCGNSSHSGCGCGDNDNGCSWIIWLLILFCCCGNGNFGCC